MRIGWINEFDDSDTARESYVLNLDEINLHDGACITLKNKPSLNMPRVTLNVGKITGDRTGMIVVNSAEMNVAEKEDYTIVDTSINLDSYDITNF